MTAPVGSILCVHPGVEVYGADRVFLQAVAAFRAAWPVAAISVVVPGEGRLTDRLRAIVGDVRIVPMVVPRRSQPWRTLASLVRLPIAVRRARRRMAGHDLVYVSTVVALDHLLALRAARGAGLVVHVHELPTGIAAWGIAALLRWSRAWPIFVSGAVQRALPELAGRGAVVWNGTRPIPTRPAEAGPVLRILMIGRFNAWKGQGVLIEAVAALDPGRVAVRLVGSGFAGNAAVERARSLIDERGLGGCVTLSGFTPDSRAHYDWADVVVVPSTRPEPFGLVAIEAMAAGRAVIATNAGGLAEIVEDGVTGRLVTPGDAVALTVALAGYRDDPAAVKRHGEAGRRRFAALFGEDRFDRAIVAAVRSAIARRAS